MKKVNSREEATENIKRVYEKYKNSNLDKETMGEDKSTFWMYRTIRW